jgi:hypothetical protein
MRRESIVAGLICLNLGLLAGMAYVYKATRQPVEVSPANTVATTPDALSKTITRTIHVPANQPEVSSRFSWRLVETPDFKQYIANLRAIGCPEQTIQDIIIAEVNKIYAAKEAALRVRPEHLKPWEVCAVSTRVMMERERKLRELLREKRALLKELLGIDIPIEMPTSFTNLSRRDVTRFEETLAKLPEGKRDLVRAFQEQYWDKTADLQARTMGFWEQQDHEEQRRLRAELRNSLAQALTPDELLDYDIGTSSTANRMRAELNAFNATDQEFRELFKIRQATEDEFTNLNPNDPESNRKREEARRFMVETTKSILGEQRYADYQRSRDWQYRNLSRLAQESGLPTETAIKAYDVQRLAGEESAKLRANPDLTKEQRDEVLRQMQSELDATMSQLLGKQAYDQFQRNYGGARIFHDRSAATLRNVVTPGGTVPSGTVILAP